MNLWSSAFGDDYTSRMANGDIAARSRVWRDIMPRNINSILEVGANVGLNIEAIQQFKSSADFFACEPNDTAREILKTKIQEDQVTADKADSIQFDTGSIDLVFTVGVLIHIPPEDLSRSITEIYRVSNKYIICGEYFAPSEEMIPYRGHTNALWRRDYGSIYLDSFPDLICRSCTFAWKRTTGLDNITFWVFEKRDPYFNAE